MPALLYGLLALHARLAPHHAMNALASHHVNLCSDGANPIKFALGAWQADLAPMNAYARLPDDLIAFAAPATGDNVMRTPWLSGPGDDLRTDANRL